MNRPDGRQTMRAAKMGEALLFLLLGRSGGLGSLGLGHSLLELVHSTGGIHELLLAGVKRMARIANADDDHGLRGSGLDYIAARATDFRVHIFRMYICFHKRPGNVAPPSSVTRPKLGFRYASNGFAISPSTSVNRKSRP